MMNLPKSWLALLLLQTLFHANSNGFATCAHWNRHDTHLWSSGESSRKGVATATSIPSLFSSTRGATFVRSRTAFIQSEESSRTKTRTESSNGEDNGAHDFDPETMIEKSHSSVNGGAIQVSAGIELPFPKHVAYDAFSDLSRQSTYSPWLKSVEYIEGERNAVGSKTRWRLAYLGLRFTWNSISTLQDPKNGIIEWESITGLQNQGRVTFQEVAEDRTYMNMTMSFAVPKIASRLLGPHKLASIVEKRILETTVRNFRQTVAENDWKQIQEQKQQLKYQKYIPTSATANAPSASPEVTSSSTCDVIRK
jgi:uncharacterized membrane protein